MFKRNTFYLLGLIFSLMFFFSCTKKVIKPKVVKDTSAQKGVVPKLELISPSPIKPIEAGKSIPFSVKGGVPPFYFFSTNYGKIEPAQIKVTGTALITARYTAPQTAGTATVFITDSKNNTISPEIKVYTPLVINPPSLTLTKNMNYKFTGFGGVEPYAFFSKIGAIDAQTGSYVAPSDKTGEEIITLYDSLGKKTTSTVTINPDLTIDPTELVMTPNGSVTFKIIGGIPPYTFSASRGEINSSGIYSSPSTFGEAVVTVTDSKGINATSILTINPGLGINPARKNLQINSSYTFTASGGALPYKYSTSNGNINASGAYTAPSSKGTATITVLDGSDKTQTSSVIIYLPINVSPTEFTLAVGNTKQFSASEGVPPYKYSTDIGTIDSATGFFMANSAGSGKVTVTDLEGNKVDAIVTIRPKLELDPKTITLSVTKNYGSFIAKNGVSPYKFSALKGTIGEFGEYTAPPNPVNDIVTVTDRLGNFETSHVTVNPKLEFKEPPKAMRPLETILLEVIGGVPPYTFEETPGLNHLGLYIFPEGIRESFVRVQDSMLDTATIKIMANLWTWIKGTNSLNHYGDYQPGDSSIPAAKIGSVGWTDVEGGNLWLFGGARGLEFFANDLWKYNINLNQWTLVNPEYSGVNKKGIYEVGVESPYTFPGGRYYPNSWTDKEGNFWLFGGGSGELDYDGKPLAAIGFNDLWKYDPKKNLWTWMGGRDQPNQPGSNILPSARHSSMSWTDNEGNFWLFGGYGKAPPEGWLNDLWKYSISANSWTRVSGSSSINQKGNYVINGTPGGRQNGLSWTDPSGNLWLFGGRGFGKNSFGYLNDLWIFDIGANKWTWVSGRDSPNQIGKYGNMGEVSPDNIPGGRQTSISWTDKSGNLWLFGGMEQFTSTSDPPKSTYYNDLWKFNITDKKWTWVSGTNLTNTPGNYGEMGMPSINNMPGARESEVSWFDSDGNLWFFGGFGYGPSGSGFLNDLWKYTPK